MNNPRFTPADLMSVLDNGSGLQAVTQTGTGLGSYRGLYREYGRETWELKPAKTVRVLFDQEQVNLEGKTAAEFGAGTGKNIIEFARQGISRAVAVEIDSIGCSALLDTVVKLEEAGHLDEGIIAVYKDDVRRYLEHSLEQFDFVTAYGLLHVFEDPREQEQLLEAMCSKVKSNGYIILQSLTDKYPAPASQPELSGVSVKQDTLHRHFESQDEWEVRYFDDTDIEHSHAGAEEEHKHGSIRMICKKNS